MIVVVIDRPSSCSKTNKSAWCQSFQGLIILATGTPTIYGLSQASVTARANYALLWRSTLPPSADKLEATAMTHLTAILPYYDAANARALIIYSHCHCCCVAVAVDLISPSISLELLAVVVARRGYYRATSV